ncbi:MAG: exosortase E/protease, VPEID-CTERM system [Terracidiphilus sp.]
MLVPRYLLGRLYLFAAVLAIDSLSVSSIPHSVSLFGPVASFAFVSFAVFAGLGYSRLKLYREEIPFSGWLFGGHLLCIAAGCIENLAALHGLAPFVNSTAGELALRAELSLGVVLLALACLPPQKWISTIRGTSPLWLFATLSGAIAACLRYPFQSFWDASTTGVGGFLQTTTFYAVRLVLKALLPGAVVDPATFVIGTNRFQVVIAKECSGMEGLGLVLVFTTVWLTYFRKESRFPQALLLVPAALACVWGLNIVRISALILIGNAGAPDVAMVGFHSQAGWIGFTVVALAFSIATRKLPWVRRLPSAVSGPTSVSDPVGVGIESGVTDESVQKAGESPATGTFLVPFLAILGASFVSKAASGYFEWLYPLRFVAAAVAIWHFRVGLKKLNWRFGWAAPLTGAGVFAIWIAASWWTKDSAGSQLGGALAALPPVSRWTWIAFRVAAAAVTVPIAEELAFRGYLARRVMNREFDTVPFSNLTILSICVSSVLFGALHGHDWIVGILAGLAYAMVLKWRGRIGDAVIAHATSNLLLAAWVLLRGDWAQW